MRMRLRFVVAAEFPRYLCSNAMYDSMEGVEYGADGVWFRLRSLWGWPARVGSLTTGGGILLRFISLYDGTCSGRPT